MVSFWGEVLLCRVDSTKAAKSPSNWAETWSSWISESQGKNLDFARWLRPKSKTGPGRVLTLIVAPKMPSLRPFWLQNAQNMVPRGPGVAFTRRCIPEKKTLRLQVEQTDITTRHSAFPVITKSTSLTFQEKLKYFANPLGPCGSIITLSEF